MALYAPTRSGELFALIKRDNNLPIEMDDSNCVVSAVTAVTGAKNTTAKITGIKYSGLRGSRTVSYNRIDLAKLFLNSRPLVHVPEDMQRDVKEAAIYIAEKLGIFVTSEDIESQPITFDAQLGVFYGTLKMVAGHPIYIGQQLVYFEGIKLDLDSLVVNRDVNSIVDNSIHETNKICLALVTYGYDYTAIAATLSKLVDQGVGKAAVIPVALAKELARELSRVDGLPWVYHNGPMPFNLYGASVMRNVAPYYDATPGFKGPQHDLRYDRIATIYLATSYSTNTGSATNGWGAMFHYDLLE